MIMMINVQEFNIAHPGHESISPKHVHDVNFGSVVGVALTKHKTFRLVRQSLPQIALSSRQPCAAAG